jgi:hypothetical protein
MVGDAPSRRACGAPGLLCEDGRKLRRQDSEIVSTGRDRIADLSGGVPAKR